MKVAYFDCGFGASGDMLIGALVAAGLSVEDWLRELEKLDLPKGSYQIKISDVMRCALSAKKVDVISHEHEHSQGEAHSHEHEHSHGEAHSHEHTHDFSSSVSDNHQDHGRNLSDIVSIIDRSCITSGAKDLATAIFNRLAVAEAKVHGTTIDQIHFHEVGAIDAIVDIVGFAIGYDMLGIQESIVSPIPVGSGRIKSAHGLYPVPGPAVVNLLADSGIAVAASPFTHECLTPTGAAILCTVAKSSGPMPSMRINSAGYGAGTFDPKGFPNVSRVVIGDALEEQKSQYSSEYVSVIETNLDDLSPQLISYAMERLFIAGALDVSVSPIVMKKSRSGHLLSVVCRFQDRVAMQELILEHTTSLGVRSYTCERLVTEREWKHVKIGNGREVRVKLARDKGGKVTNAQPEYEDCAAYATEFGIPLKDVIATAITRLTYDTY